MSVPVSGLQQISKLHNWTEIRISTKKIFINNHYNYILRQFEDSKRVCIVHFFPDPALRESRKRKTIAAIVFIYQWEAPGFNSPTITFSPLPLGLIARDFLCLFPDSEPNLIAQNSSRLWLIHEATSFVCFLMSRKPPPFLSHICYGRLNLFETLQGVRLTSKRSYYNSLPIQVAN